MAGVKNIKEVAVCLAKFIKGGFAAAEDGKFSLGDLTHFVAAGLSVPAAIGDFGEVSVEYADIDEKEMEEVTQALIDEADFPLGAAAQAAPHFVKAAGEIALGCKKIFYTEKPQP